MGSKPLVGAQVGGPWSCPTDPSSPTIHAKPARQARQSGQARQSRSSYSKPSNIYPPYPKSIPSAAPATTSLTSCFFATIREAPTPAAQSNMSGLKLNIAAKKKAKAV